MYLFSFKLKKMFLVIRFVIVKYIVIIKKWIMSMRRVICLSKIVEYKRIFFVLW